VGLADELVVVEVGRRRAEAPLLPMRTLSGESGPGRAIDTAEAEHAARDPAHLARRRAGVEDGDRAVSRACVGRLT
jgi:hypothetical protein